MNKHDYILVSIILTMVFSIFMVFKFNEKDDVEKAFVYYENDVVLKIDLNKKMKEYKVNGANGEVVILAGEGKIKVKQENSNQHLCSKQGYISKSYESIICLPNKIVIKLESNSELDTIVG